MSAKKTTKKKVSKKKAVSKSKLKSWAKEIAVQYESNSSSQFIIHGNINDRVVVNSKKETKFGRIEDYLINVLLDSFDVVLSYDLGNGLRCEKGKGQFSTWSKSSDLPRKPLDSFDRITHYLRYCANLRQLGTKNIQVAVIIRASHLILPAGANSTHYDLNAMALLTREWSTETSLLNHEQATFLLCENVADLHSLVANNPSASQIRIPLPDSADLIEAMEHLRTKCPTALKNYPNLKGPAGELTGATISSIEALLKTREFEKSPIKSDDLAELKRLLVERDCQGLIEFVEPDRTLDDVFGHEAVKKWMKGDMDLWKKGDLKAVPMGYLLCGPVGTGKTYLVECLAGEAGVPVVKLKNFRDRWVGSTEGNLEKIFRLLEALGRCIVFIDEADQALGKRNTDGDSGVSGRVYSMMAKMMSNTKNRGKILWILASSRPDLIEIDLKRPGRIDVKFPLFPAYDERGGYFFIRALAKKQSITLPKTMPKSLKGLIPEMVTPGAAESLAVRVYRMVKTQGMKPLDALIESLEDYQSPVPEHIMKFQIEIAAQEATDIEYIPQKYRDMIKEMNS